MAKFKNELKILQYDSRSPETDIGIKTNLYKIFETNTQNRTRHSLKDNIRTNNISYFLTYILYTQGMLCYLELSIILRCNEA